MLQLGWDARYIRWSTRQRGWVPSEEAVLAAVLEQGKPAVSEALVAGGVNSVALITAALTAAGTYRYDSQYAERGDSVRAVFGHRAEQAARCFRTKRTGFVESSDFLHTEHLLAGLLEAASGPAYQLVRDHGGRPDQIVEALRAAAEAYTLETDLTWRDRLVREAWYQAHAARPASAAAPARPWTGYPVAHWHLGPLLTELKDAQAYPLLAELCTALASAGSMFNRSDPHGERGRQTFPAQDLVMAAHYHRLSGNLENAAWCARRAIADVARLSRYIDTIGSASYEIAYFRELQADAAVCSDRQLAGALYQEALLRFSKLSDTVQAGEGAEDYGWGGFHTEQASAFLPGDPRDVRDSARARIGRKLEHWLGITP